MQSREEAVNFTQDPNQIALWLRERTLTLRGCRFKTYDGKTSILNLSTSGYSQAQRHRSYLTLTRTCTSV